MLPVCGSFFLMASHFIHIHRVKSSERRRWRRRFIHDAPTQINTGQSDRRAGPGSSSNYLSAPVVRGDGLLRQSGQFSGYRSETAEEAAEATLNQPGSSLSRLPVRAAGFLGHRDDEPPLLPRCTTSLPVFGSLPVCIRALSELDQRSPVCSTSEFRLFEEIGSESKWFLWKQDVCHWGD